jgi:hypothetical protein
MPRRNDNGGRIIVPPQFIDSPSERKGFYFQRIPWYGLFSCATILVLLIGFGVVVLIKQFNPGSVLPVKGEIVFLFGLAAWLLIASVLQSSDIERGVAIPGRITSGPVPPWLLALSGIIVLIIGVAQLLNSH